MRSSRFAVEPQRDEDNLGRDEEAPDDSLAILYFGLRRGSESAARNAMALAQILERMVHSASRGDTESLTRWHHTCQEIIAKVAEETGGE